MGIDADEALDVLPAALVDLYVHELLKDLKRDAEMARLAAGGAGALPSLE